MKEICIRRVADITRQPARATLSTVGAGPKKEEDDSCATPDTE